MKTFTRIATAFFLSGSILAVVQAKPSFGIPTAVVKFGNLDMTLPAAKEELYQRLSRAAQAVCSPGGGKKALLTPQYEACISQALSGALRQFDRPDFAHYVSARTTKSVASDTRVASR